ncbi:hypothetical protein ACI2JA_19715 [Alkalihalobacillus sp. NPDC078783]|uniref:hypothetical protein n=1 Tax=Streptomyces albidoflavus TaxID=1886 RepID=UPI0033F81F9B
MNNKQKEELIFKLEDKLIQLYRAQALTEDNYKQAVQIGGEYIHKVMEELRESREQALVGFMEDGTYLFEDGNPYGDDFQNVLKYLDDPEYDWKYYESFVLHLRNITEPEEYKFIINTKLQHFDLIKEYLALAHDIELIHGVTENETVSDAMKELFETSEVDDLLSMKPQELSLQSLIDIGKYKYEDEAFNEMIVNEMVAANELRTERIKLGISTYEIAEDAEEDIALIEAAEHHLVPISPLTFAYSNLFALYEVLG